MAEHRCDHCDKTFKSANALTQHQRDTNHYPKEGQSKAKDESSKRPRAQAGRLPQRTWLIAGGAGLVLILAVVVAFVGLNQNQSSNSSSLGRKIPILDRNHVPAGTEVTSYNSNPPTSGPHWPQAAAWGVYASPVPDEAVVHSLEHGGIWISYRDIDEGTRLELEKIAQKYPQAVILTPRPQNDSKIALASWGRLDTFDAFDQERIENFIKANINDSPEQFASLEQPAVQIGLQAPEATFTTIGGERMTLSQFRGQKVMFWFFATWCPSCIAGAQALSQNNAALRDLTIIALKTHGNAGFPGPSVEGFAQRYAPARLRAFNWLWGEASQPATRTYNPRNFPDIYFLIDEQGTVQDIDGAPAATLSKIIRFANG
ncbi:MAG: DUF3105 domain-containing protein [Candidatus Bipolaricaulia bacterium]